MASIVKKAFGDGSAAYLVRFRTVDGKQRSKQFSRKKERAWHCVGVTPERGAFEGATPKERALGPLKDADLLLVNRAIEQFMTVNRTMQRGRSR